MPPTCSFRYFHCIGRIKPCPRSGRAEGPGWERSGSRRDVVAFCLHRLLPFRWVCVLGLIAAGEDAHEGDDEVERQVGRLNVEGRTAARRLDGCIGQRGVGGCLGVGGI